MHFWNREEIEYANCWTDHQINIACFDFNSIKVQFHLLPIRIFSLVFQSRANIIQANGKIHKIKLLPKFHHIDIFKR